MGYKKGDKGKGLLNLGLERKKIIWGLSFTWLVIRVLLLYNILTTNRMHIKVIQVWWLASARDASKNDFSWQPANSVFRDLFANASWRRVLHASSLGHVPGGAVANLGPRSCLWGKRLGRGGALYFELRSINYSVAWVLPEQLSRCSERSLALTASSPRRTQTHKASQPH